MTCIKVASHAGFCPGVSRAVELMEQAIRDGKRVAVPKCYDRDMKFIYISDFEREVAPGYANIPEPIAEKGILATAWEEGLIACEKAPSIATGIKQNFIDGINMALGIAPSLMSIGFLGLLIAEYTPLFSIIGYIFVPFALLLGFGGEQTCLRPVLRRGLGWLFPRLRWLAGKGRDGLLWLFSFPRGN